MVITDDYGPLAAAHGQRTAEPGPPEYTRHHVSQGDEGAWRGVKAVLRTQRTARVINPATRAISRTQEMIKVAVAENMY